MSHPSGICSLSDIHENVFFQFTSLTLKSVTSDATSCIGSSPTRMIVRRTVSACASRARLQSCARWSQNSFSWKSQQNDVVLSLMHMGWTEIYVTYRIASIAMVVMVVVLAMLCAHAQTLSRALIRPYTYTPTHTPMHVGMGHVWFHLVLHSQPQ